MTISRSVGSREGHSPPFSPEQWMRKMSLATETSRLAPKLFDRDRAHRNGFPTAGPALDEDTKAQIYRRFRTGVSAEVLSRRYGRTRSSIYRVINEMRLRRISAAKLEFIHHESFDEPCSDATILTALPEPADGKAPRRYKAPKGLPSYLASLYEAPLLDRAQEQHLFRKMNYLKYLAHQRLMTVDPGAATTSDLDEIEQLQEEALAVKNQIIRSNLRLVVSIAKRQLGASSNFFELVSDGNMSLIRAVDKFDFSRGNKFSTYATWSIVKNFSRTIPEDNRRRNRFVTGHEEMFEAATDTRADEYDYESAFKQVREVVRGMLGRLDEREQRIIRSRFGLGGVNQQTLEQIGRELGISKERVRQLEARAQDKLRRIASKEKLDLPTLADS
jgi:RNA polymerase primary sigma factor